MHGLIIAGYVKLAQFVIQNLLDLCELVGLNPGFLARSVTCPQPVSIIYTSEATSKDVQVWIRYRYIAT